MLARKPLPPSRWLARQLLLHSPNITLLHFPALPAILSVTLFQAPLHCYCAVLQVRGTQALVDCLLEHASGLQADLIVMGSHQISKPDSALIGSVALSLLKKCER